MINDVEKAWQRAWSRNDYYRWDKNQSNIYTVDTPPPTISGFLHMGHIFSYTQMDFVVRFNRMLGKNTIYTIGFDNNGIPTEKLIKKYICNKRKIHGNISRLMLITENKFRKLYEIAGIGFDWSLEYRTIDAISSKISQISFLDLYSKRLINRKKSPVFWDMKNKTAISQSDIQDMNVINKIYKIVFDKKNGFFINSTRPEMISSCSAIFYYQKTKLCFNNTVILPLFKRKTKFIKGNSMYNHIMCCTFGDTKDVYIYRKHKLNIKRNMDLEGNNINSGPLCGIKILTAKYIVIKYLAFHGLVTYEKIIISNTKFLDKTNFTLEIVYIYHWHIKLLGYKIFLQKKTKKISWYPNFMKRKLENWIKGINQDWCISRQRYFGVSLPILFNQDFEIILPCIEELPISKHHVYQKKCNYNIESGVMDTWATSSLTVQILSLGINKNFILDDRFYSFFPFDLRSQSHEIIRTWAFLTIVKSLFHCKIIPWHRIIISGWCKINKKIKMSKSRRNLICPNLIINKYGSDVIRYWAASFKLGIDIVYDKKNFKLSQKIINKMWNLFKFLSLKIYCYKADKLEVDQFNSILKYSIERWLINKILLLWSNIRVLFDKQNFLHLRNFTHSFVFCDFELFIKMLKKRFNYNIFDKKYGIFLALGYSCYIVLNTLYPFIPHVVCEIMIILFNLTKTDIKYSNIFFINIVKIPNINFIMKYFKSDILNIFKIVCYNIRVYKLYFYDLKNIMNCKKVFYSKMTYCHSKKILFLK